MPILKISYLFLLATLAVTTAHAQIKPPVDPAEDLLLKTIHAIENSDWDNAKAHNQTLIKQHPTFKLGPIVQTYIEKKQLPPKTPASPVQADTDEFIQSNLEAELYLRSQYKQYQTKTAYLPKSILKLSQHQEFTLLLDSTLSRLYLIQNSRNNFTNPIIIADYYAAIGKQGLLKQQRDDHRTPIGIYKIVDYIPDNKLLERYGIAAFPINYPNHWDQRLNRTGSGIWLHGVPRLTYSRPPRSSRGCVTLSNHILDGLKPYIKTKSTHLIITKKIDWIKQDEWKLLQNSALNTLEKWRKDWESLNFDRYIAHYSKDFKTKKTDFDSWSARKQLVNENKHNIQITLSDISIFYYPGETDLIQINYSQDYKSNNYNSTMKNQQFWKKEADGQWRIIYEGAN